MEKLDLKVEEQGFPHRLSDRMRGGYEHIRRNLTTYIAVGAVAAAFAGAELSPAESAAASSDTPAFKAGRYAGTTSQTCTSAENDKGLCDEGEDIPLSFIITGQGVVGLKTTVNTMCYSAGNEDAPSSEKSFRIRFNSFGLSTEHGFTESQLTGNGFTQKIATGNVKGTKAQGALGFVISLNEAGKPDPQGSTVCEAGLVTFDAGYLGNSFPPK